MKQLIIIIVLIVIVGMATIYILGNPFTNKIGILNISTSTKPLSLTDRGFYKVYIPKKYKSTEIKRIILVIQPDNNYLGSINRWHEQSDKYGFELAVIPNWTFELITEFNIDARQNNDIDKIYYSGFSHGGYTSCGQGLSNQKYVNGIIPMGSYCRDFDLDGQSQTIPILTIIGDQDKYALGDDLIRPDQQLYSNAKNINTKYILIPGLAHQFPTSYMDEVGKWIMQN